MNYGKVVRTLRVNRGLQQKELAEMLGVDTSYISLIENGKRKPSLELLSSMAAVLRVPVYLLTLLASEKEDLHGGGPQAAQALAAELLHAFSETFSGKPK